MSTMEKFLAQQRLETALANERRDSNRRTA